MELPGGASAGGLQNITRHWHIRTVAVRGKAGNLHAVDKSVASGANGYHEAAALAV